MADIDSIISQIKQGITQIATTQCQDYIAQIQQDGDAFLRASKDDLQTWLEQLSSGQLSKEDFEFAVQGRKEALEMDALTQAGLSVIRVEAIRSAIIKLIIAVLVKAIPIP